MTNTSIAIIVVLAITLLIVGICALLAYRDRKREQIEREQAAYVQSVKSTHHRLLDTLTKNTDSDLYQNFLTAADSSARKSLFVDSFIEHADSKYAIYTADQMAGHVVSAAWQRIQDSLMRANSIKVAYVRLKKNASVEQQMQNVDQRCKYEKEVHAERQRAKAQAANAHRIARQEQEAAQAAERARNEVEYAKISSSKARAKRIYADMTTADKRALASRSTSRARKSQIVSSYYSGATNNDFLIYLPLVLAVASDDSTYSTGHNTAYGYDFSQDAGSSYGGSSHSGNHDHGHNYGYGSSYDSGSSHSSSHSSYDSGSSSSSWSSSSDSGSSSSSFDSGGSW